MIRDDAMTRATLGAATILVAAWSLALLAAWVMS
jgi:hypothetical protein